MKAIILWLLLWCLPAYAGTFYIDPSGSDSNNGTSTSTPWQHCYGMPGFSATYSHTAGDRFIFKGGASYTNLPVQPAGGGASSAYDYYGVDKTWFTGSSWTNPKFDSGATTNNGFFFPTADWNAYVTLDGIEFTNFHWLTFSANSSFGYVSFGQQDFCNVYNCIFHGWSHADYASGGRDSFNAVGHASSPVHGGNDVISNCLFEANSCNGDAGAAVYACPILQHCTISNMPNAALLGGGSNILVSDCVIHDLPEAFDPGTHGNGIETINGFTTCIVSNLTMFNVQGQSFLFEASTNQAVTLINVAMWGVTAPIEYALVQEDHVTPVPGQTFSIYNSTMVTGSQGIFSFGIDSAVGTMATLTLKNCQFINDSGGNPVHLATGNTITTTVSDHNLTNTTAAATSAGYVASNQYQPTSAASPTVGIGTPVFNPAYDIFGNLRSPTAPNAGAYEYTNALSVVIMFLPWGH